MKHILSISIVLLMTACSSSTLWAQTENDLKLVEACKKEVKEINSQALYKEQLFWSSVSEDRPDYKVSNYREVSEKAKLNPPAVKPTVEYDEATEAGKELCIYNEFAVESSFRSKKHKMSNL